MTFIKPTINDGNPGPAVYGGIEPIMIADGWELVDTVVISTYTYKVLKSPAAGNIRNLDWYLAIAYPTTGIGAGIKFTPFEAYTVATHLAFRGPMFGGAGVALEQTNFSRFGNTGAALDSANSTGNGLTVSNLSVALSSSSFTYYFSATRNRVWFFSTATTTRALYTGFFTPTTAHATYAGSALFPLVQIGMTSDGITYSNSTITSTRMGITRMPRYGTVDLASSTMAVAPRHLLSGIIGGANGAATNETVIVPCAIDMGQNGDTVQGMVFVGYTESMALGSVIGSAVRGDTVTIGSDTWYMLTPSSGFTILLQAL